MLNSDGFCFSTNQPMIRTGESRKGKHFVTYAMQMVQQIHIDAASAASPMLIPQTHARGLWSPGHGMPVLCKHLHVFWKTVAKSMITHEDKSI